MASVFQTSATATKPEAFPLKEMMRVGKNLFAIINREVKAGNPHAIAFLSEAMRA